MKNIFFALIILSSFSAHAQLEGGFILNSNGIRLTTADGSVVETYGDFKSNRATNVTLRNGVNKEIRNVLEKSFFSSFISQTVVAGVPKNFPSIITEAKIADPYNALIVRTAFGPSAEPESRTNCKVSMAKGEYFKRTGRKLSCYTANPGLCSRLEKLKTSLQKADFMKLSADLKSCANTISGLQGISSELNEYLRTKEYQDLAKTEATNMKEFVDANRKDFDLAKVDEVFQPDGTEFFTAGKLKGTLDLADVARSFERISEASVACSGLEESTKAINNLIGRKVAATATGPAAALPPAAAEGAPGTGKK